MKDHPAISEHFARLLRGTSVHAGFAAPATGEACVLIFDSDCWMDHVTVARALLSVPERARADRFRTERDRSIYTLAHASWRVVLSWCLQVDVSAVPLSSRASGQPVLEGTPLSTSLSHSGSWVAIAVAHASTIGVDIERAPPSLALANLRDTICTPAESTRVMQLPEAQREQALLNLWVRKEALLKAFGTGLLETPSSLEAWTDAQVSAPWSSDLPACVTIELPLSQGLLGMLALPIGIRLACSSVLQSPTSSS